MGTSKPKIQGYIDQDVFDKFESWYKERNIRNVSNALEVLMRDYFYIEANTLIARIEALERKFEALAGQSTSNSKVDNPITSTNDLKVDDQSTSSLKVDNPITSTNDFKVDDQSTSSLKVDKTIQSTYNPKQDYIDITTKDLMVLYGLTADQIKRKSSQGWFQAQGWSSKLNGRKMFYTKYGQS